MPKSLKKQRKENVKRKFTSFTWGYTAESIKKITSFLLCDNVLYHNGVVL